MTETNFSPEMLPKKEKIKSQKEVGKSGTSFKIDSNSILYFFSQDFIIFLLGGFCWCTCFSVFY